MVLGDNKGHKYEKHVAAMLRSRGVRVVGEAAGSGMGTDIVFLHKGRKFGLESKEGCSNADWGQTLVVPKMRRGNWTWCWSENGRGERKPVHDLFDSLEFTNGTVGVLNYLDGTGFIPNKHRLSDGELDRETYAMDQKIDRRVPITIDAFQSFYRNKAQYIQVKKHGFFHIVSDPAHLGTARIDADFELRVRAKAIHTHWIRCSRCKGEYVPPSKRNKVACPRCGRKMTGAHKPCPDCGVGKPYSDFKHVYHHYAFFVVIKCKKIRNASKFDIDKSDTRSFPPISARSP